MVPTAPTTPSPLGRLGHHERERVIAALTERLPRTDAVALLAALAGTRAEIEALPVPLQERAQEILLAALPPGVGAVVVSTLGIPVKSAQEALEEVLTEPEKADPAFRRRVEEEAERRGIPPWQAAIRLRWDEMGVDGVAAMIERRQAGASGKPSTAERRGP